MNILVIGYFGYLNNQLDGQTIRTRSIYELLDKNIDNNIKLNFFDTQQFKANKLYLFKLIYLLLKSNLVFDIAAHNNIKYLFILIFFICKLKRTKLNIVAVGGWLSNFIQDKPLHQQLLSRVNNLFVQTENLSRSLKNNYNFSNVVVLNNFRNVEYPVISSSVNHVLKLVFFARVQPMKGVDLIFKLSEKIRQENISNVEIDIYGPISDFYQKDFDKSLSESNVKYCGVLQPNNIHAVLADYDFMLFPTKYFTEGFPGSILDSYISGVPVIATNWLNAKEFIDNDETGYIVEFDNDEKFIEKTIYLLKYPELIRKLKENVIKKRYLYSPEEAWKTLGLSLK